MTTAAVSSTDPKQRRPLHVIVAELVVALDEADGQVTAAVDELGLELEDKVQAYRAVILQREQARESIVQLTKYYERQIEGIDNQVTGLKFRLEEAMQAAGVEKIKTPTCTAYFQTSKRVELTMPEALFVETAEDRFVVVKAAPNKQELKKVLEAGEQVEGAKLAESRHLRFR